jgi:hypothetical protein
MKLAQTGRFQYNDWVTSTLLFQSVWGALWIRIFGFSFDLLRIATLPFSLGSVYLVYVTGRRLGLAPTLASLGALTFGTSPLFLPHAATFMTEPYTCFFTLACVYAFVRITQAGTGSQATQWLTVLSITCLLGCSNRQIMCVAPAALIPCSMWDRRKDRAFLLRAVLAGAVCMGATVLLEHFFGRPYAPLELSHAQLMNIVRCNAPKAAGQMISLFLCGFMLLLPALFCFLGRWKPLKIALLSLASLIGGAAAFFSLGGPVVAPYLGITLTTAGILTSTMLATDPLLLTAPVRLIVSWIVFMFSAGFAYEIVRYLRAGVKAVVPSALILYSVLYAALLIPGALVLFEYDRYILPLVPLWILVVLLTLGTSKPRVPVAAWLCLFVFGAYAVATTHDYFAGLRARALVARQTERLGVPRDHIAAGFENDGWTQLSLTGRVVGTRYEDHLVDDSAKGVWYAVLGPRLPSLIRRTTLLSAPADRRRAVRAFPG